MPLKTKLVQTALPSPLKNGLNQPMLLELFLNRAGMAVHLHIKILPLNLQPG